MGCTASSASHINTDDAEGDKNLILSKQKIVDPGPQSNENNFGAVTETETTVVNTKASSEAPTQKADAASDQFNFADFDPDKFTAADENTNNALNHDQPGIQSYEQPQGGLMQQEIDTRTNETNLNNTNGQPQPGGQELDFEDIDDEPEMQVKNTTNFNAFKIQNATAQSFSESLEEDAGGFTDPTKTKDMYKKNLQQSYGFDLEKFRSANDNKPARRGSNLSSVNLTAEYGSSNLVVRNVESFDPNASFDGSISISDNSKDERYNELPGVSGDQDGEADADQAPWNQNQITVNDENMDPNEMYIPQTNETMTTNYDEKQSVIDKEDENLMDEILNFDV